MLEAAHQAKQEGVDVVVGYVKPHARPDTLALLEGWRRFLRQRSSTMGFGCGSSIWIWRCKENPI